MGFVYGSVYLGKVMIEMKGKMVLEWIKVKEVGGVGWRVRGICVVCFISMWI